MWSPPAKAVHIAYSHSYIIPPESLGCNKKLTNRFSPSTVGRKSIRCYRHVKINGYDGYATPAGGWANTPRWARVIIIVLNWDVIALKALIYCFLLLHLLLLAAAIIAAVNGLTWVAVVDGVAWVLLFAVWAVVLEWKK